MHARSAVIQMSPDKIDAAVKQFQDEMLPRYREVSGYKGFKMFADREGGKVLGISLWETADGIAASDEVGVQARRSLAETGGGTEQPRDVWEVVVDE
jgi:heme-degrading monooxygenase HmoA